ncbi:mitochondrial carrier 2 [Echinococcus multilocularis]|uniref:Mitochondrial carrier 2 n=1 Tax=Echinococcus multilocularis TaxID=6211 RepID=A0A068Y9P8_ECHMU|nr:mitochondrial carrier 2 [Echinococcus multilocularis]
MTCGFFSSFCFDFLTEVFYFMSHRYIVERALCAEEWLDDTEVMEKPKSRFGEGLVDRIPLSQFTAHLLNLCLLEVHKVVITQPFYVIMVRQGASIIGKEVGHSWFHQAVLSIFRDNGIMGFFSGITPRLMFELSPMIIYLCARRMLQQNIFSSLRSWSKTVHSCIHTLSYAVINFLAYRLEVVSCVMALHGSRIPTVEAAVANSFSGWRECRRTLAMTGQLQRGYFPFWRFCPTPSFAPL